MDGALLAIEETEVSGNDSPTESSLPVHAATARSPRSSAATFTDFTGIESNDRGEVKSLRTATDGNHPQQVIPAAFDTRLDDIGIEFLRARVELTHLLGSRDTSALSREPRPEHVCDQLEFGLLTNRTRRSGLRANVFRRTNQFGVRIADLIERKSTFLDLTDEHPACETMINDAARSVSATERTDRETHEREG